MEVVTGCHVQRKMSHFEANMHNELVGKPITIMFTGFPGMCRVLGVILPPRHPSCEQDRQNCAEAQGFHGTNLGEIDFYGNN
jgi:hypothetical protein